MNDLLVHEELVACVKVDISGTYSFKCEEGTNTTCIRTGNFEFNELEGKSEDGGVDIAFYHIHWFGQAEM